jgi:glycosyltransferase involved in cell wall biosynthesis
MVALSVIIPHHDAPERLLPRLSALEQALARAAATSEIIVIDDHLPEPARKHLQAGLASFPKVRYLALSSGAGVEAAIAAGIQLAKHDALLIFDACGYSPGCVERMAQRLARHDLVCGVRRATGWRKFLIRLLAAPQRLCGGPARDTGCHVWAARREALCAMPVERGRLIWLPTLIARAGYRVGESPIDWNSAERGAWQVGRTRWLQLAHAWWSAPRAAAALTADAGGATHEGVRIDAAHPLAGPAAIGRTETATRPERIQR